MTTRNPRSVIIVLLILIVITAVIYHFKWLFQSHRNSIPPPTSKSRSFKNAIPSILAQHPPGVSDISATPLMLQHLGTPDWTLRRMRELFFTEVLRVHLQCSNVVRFGQKGDGGWDVCMDSGFSLEPGCLTYSFGIANYWGYDEQLATRHKCTARTFDMTMNKAQHIHNPGPVYFYPLGIAGKNKAHNTDTLLNILKRFKEEKKVIDVLKMDVEYSEWDSLITMFEDGLLKQVKQLFLEYHTNEVNSQRSELEHYRLYLLIMQYLERAGFRKFQATQNSGAIPVFQRGLSELEKSSKEMTLRSCCHEVYYINTAFKRKTQKQ